MSDAPTNGNTLHAPRWFVMAVIGLVGVLMTGVNAILLLQNQSVRQELDDLRERVARLEARP